MKVIVFVCRGNIARSPFAAELLKKQLRANGLGGEFEVMSRGVQGTTADPKPVKHPNIQHYTDLYKEAVSILQQYGVDLSRHASRPIDENIVGRANMVFAMDKSIQCDLLRLFPGSTEKIRLFGDIADPEGAAPKHLKGIFDKISDIIQSWHRTNYTWR